jgi:hypothetical protein
MQPPLESLPLPAEPSDRAVDDGRLGSVLEYEPISLLHREPAERMCTRYRRYREIGLP